MPKVPPYIEDLRAYEPGRSIDEVRQAYGLTRVAKLASNENPLGPSPVALAAIAKSIAGVNSYPNGGLDLRTRLAEKFNLKVGNVIAGSGSDSVMASIMRAYLAPGDEVLTTEGAFIGFQVQAKGAGADYRTVPYREWHYDLAALAGAVTEKTKIVYLANPNNPTGTIFSKDEFEAFYKRVPERVLIILDEAYFEYAQANGKYPDSLDYRYDNVITLRTFSKIYGLAGLRVGHGFAHEDIITNLMKVKLPFEPGALAQIAGVAALEDREFVERTLELNARGLRMIGDALKRMGLDVVPSDANFVMVPLEDASEAKWMTDQLLKKGVIVRPLGAFGMPQCVRISTGTDEDNRMLLDAMEELYLKEAK